MKPKQILITTVLALSVGSAAHAEWTITKNSSFIGGYSVSNGKETVRMADEKAARQAAKALNKAEKKGAKSAKDSGFKPEESGPCANPRPGMNC
ncbi:MAG: hypothetical protein H6934_05095 [Burkholderiaceae bacterium]|nr:hypothetical protein [Burkholderiaceae bacterium]